MNNGANKILKKALDHQRLTSEEAIKLFYLENEELDHLYRVADFLRNKTLGNNVIYVVNRNINFTNICTIRCNFCAFHEKNLSSTNAYFLNIDQILKRIEEAHKIGVTEVCIQGGIAPDLDLNYYKDMLIKIKKFYPDIHVHGFSPFEIFMASRKSNISIREGLTILKNAGLDSIPGTAAEILVDDIRKIICENKFSVANWIRVIKMAHELSIPSTSTILYGHIESYKDRVEHLKIIRDIQDETHGFTEFVPLAFINLNHSLELESSRNIKNDESDDLKMIAISRLFLDNIPNIQVSWVKIGPELAQKGLNCGANDFGGTIMEENISKSAGATYGEYLEEEKIRKIILNIKRTPVQRTTTYKLLEEEVAPLSKKNNF